MTSQRQIEFLSNNIRISAILYCPPQSAPDRQHAAIILSCPYDSNKEAVTGRYASILAENGYIALAFDSAHRGESEGEPRYFDNPYQRAEDIRSAVTYLSRLNFVDLERIGALGFGTGGGFAVFAAQTDHRIKAVATISASCMGALTREGIRGTEHELKKSDVQESLRRAGKARTAQANGQPIPTKHVLPGSGGHSVLRSLDALVNHDSFAFVDWIAPRPLLMIAGDEADTRYFSEQAIEKAQHPKKLVIMKGESHFGLYNHIEKTLPEILEFFQQSLVESPYSPPHKESRIDEVMLPESISAYGDYYRSSV